MSAGDDPVTFSVVIPTHNGRESIARAVESVLGQTHMALDVVVVCDGDAARTKGLLADVLDPRLRIVEQPRTGVCAARNRGVAVTANPWVVFLDDDDSARPTWLELLARGATGAGVDVVTARLAFWEGDRIAEVRDCRLSPGDPTMGASTILPGGLRGAAGGVRVGRGVRRVAHLLREPGPRVAHPRRPTDCRRRRQARPRGRRRLPPRGRIGSGAEVPQRPRRLGPALPRPLRATVRR